MSPKLLINSCAIALLCVGTAGAQDRPKDRPSFTGTWIHQGGATQSEHAPRTLKITDTPSVLTIESTSAGQTETLNFSHIGASEALKAHAPEDGVTGGATLVQETKASWHDDHLDTFIARQISGKTVTQNMHYMLDSTGTRLVVEKDLQVHHGYQSSSAASAEVKDVYLKQ